MTDETVRYELIENVAVLHFDDGKAKASWSSWSGE